MREGEMLVASNGWLSVYHHGPFWHCCFVFWGSGMQCWSDLGKDEDMDKSRIRNMRSLLH
jgi:hypothetical protein